MSNLGRWRDLIHWLHNLTPIEVDNFDYNMVMCRIDQIKRKHEGSKPTQTEECPCKYCKGTGKAFLDGDEKCPDCNDTGKHPAEGKKGELK